jgi:hypothetical protein
MNAPSLCFIVAFSAYICNLFLQLEALRQHQLRAQAPRPNTSGKQHKGECALPLYLCASTEEQMRKPEKQVRDSTEILGRVPAPFVFQCSNTDEGK